MPLQLNPLEIGALAGLAAKSEPRLFLPTHELDLGAPMAGTAQGLQQNLQYQRDLQAGAAKFQGDVYLQQLKNDATNKQNLFNQAQENYRAQIKNTQDMNIALMNNYINQQRNQGLQQYQQGLLQNDTAKTQLQAQQNQGLNQYHNQILANDALKVKADQDRAQAESMKADVAQKTLASKDSLEQRKAVGAGAIVALMNGDLAGAQTLFTQAHQNKQLPDDQYQALMQIKDPKKALGSVVADFQLTDFALKQQEQNAKNGVGQDGSSKLAPAEVADAQKRYMALDNLEQNIQGTVQDLQANKDKYNSILAKPGLIAGTVGAAEDIAQVNNGPGTYADLRNQRMSVFDKARGFATQYATAMGTKPSSRTIDLGLKQLPQESNTYSADTAISKYTDMLNQIRSNKATYGYALKNGINLSPSTWDDVSSKANPSSTSSSSSSKVYNDKDIAHAVSKGMSVEDAHKFFESQGYQYAQ